MVIYTFTKGILWSVIRGNRGEKEQVIKSVGADTTTVSRILEDENSV